jgi:mono/diheme cytochrome c family protein
MVVGSNAQTPAPETIKVSGALYTDAQALRGEVVFRKYCLGCHRENLHSGEGDLSLTGPFFLDYWGLVSIGGMVNMIRTTMPSDAPPNTITVPQAVDMVAYILWLNYYPVGTRELPTDLATLNRWTLQTPDEHLQQFIAKMQKIP